MHIVTAGQIKNQRLLAARAAIEKAGGPKPFAEKLSKYTGSLITVDRVNKWRYIGIPCEWGPVVSDITGIALKSLNPWELTETPQVVNRAVIREILGLSATSAPIPEVVHRKAQP